MGTFFLDIVNMSVGASCVILVVLVLRLLLRRGPKKYSYLLWSVVGLRLCCPVSFRSAYSLFRLKPLQNLFSPGGAGSSPVFLPEVHDGLKDMAGADYGTALFRPESGDVGLPLHLFPAEEQIVIQIPRAFDVMAAVWMAGIIALMLFGAVNLFRLRRRLAASVLLEGNVWQSEQVCSPFILGILRPAIYIPFDLDGGSLKYVLAHERAHIRRGDHLIKLIAFLLQAMHWFNPLVWLAFYLMTKDMEMSCDEKVLAEMGRNGGQDGDDGAGKKIYSMSLLSFAANRRFPAPGFLAFGETAVKSRIRNVLGWKKPKLWVSVCTAGLCLVVMAACAANPADGAGSGAGVAGGTGVAGEAGAAGESGATDAENPQDDDYAGEAAAFTEELLRRYSQGDWDDLAEDYRSGQLRIEEGQKGYYEISGLRLSDGCPEAHAGAAIRQMDDGPVWLSAALVQALGREKGGAELRIQIDADISDPDRPVIMDYTLTVEKYGKEVVTQTEISEHMDKDMQISEDVLQEAVICISKTIPALAAAQD